MLTFSWHLLKRLVYFTLNCNNAFIIDGVKRAELIAQHNKSAEIIKPLAVGKDVDGTITHYIINLPKAATLYNGSEKAFRILNQMNLSTKEKDMYNGRLDFLRQLSAFLGMCEKRGKDKTKLKYINILLSLKCSIEEISELTGYSIPEIRRLRKSITLLNSENNFSSNDKRTTINLMHLRKRKRHSTQSSANSKKFKEMSNK